MPAKVNRLLWAGALLVAGRVEAKVDYQWGEVGCGGLAIGLRLDQDTARSNQPIRYSLAVANRSDRPRTVTLYFDFDGPYRTQILVHHEKSTTPFAAVGANMPTTSGARIEVQIAPGQVHERAGDPFKLGPEFVGVSWAEIVWGGVPQQKCELRSGRAKLTINP